MAQVVFDPLSGVVIPSTKAVRDDLAKQIQDALPKDNKGNPVNVDSASPLGQIVDLITAEAEAKNAEIAFLANQFNPAVATGIFLDGLAALYGLKRKTSEATVVQCTCTGLRGTVIPYGAIVQDDSGNQLRHSVAAGAVIGDSGSVKTYFATVEHGAVEVGPETVKKIVTVVAGWDAVTNVAAGVLGRDVESDAELFNRMLDSYAINGNGTVENIESNLKALDGVLDCRVLENISNEQVTMLGVVMEPHSIGVSIIGGDDGQIAEVLFKRKPGGTGTSGKTTVTFLDQAHLNAVYTYKIIRPTAKAFKIQVTFFGDQLNETTQDEVRQVLVRDFNGEFENPRVGLGTTVFASRFYSAIQSVSSAPIKQVLVGLGEEPLATSVVVSADMAPTISTENIEFKFEDVP